MATVKLPETVRPLFAIAAEVRTEWQNVYFGAVPYLDAMSSLGNTHDSYGYDGGDEIVLYFLSNATTFRGEAARRIKAELKAHLAGHPVR